MYLKSSSEVRDLISNDYIKKIPNKNVTTGLPEYNDRSKKWRTSLVFMNKSVGIVYYSALDGKLDIKKSSSLSMIYRKIQRIKEEPKQIKTKRDNTYYISPLKSSMILGDSIKELKKLPKNSIDMVFTSPPYYNAKTEYSEYISYDDYLKFIKKIIKEVDRVLIPGKFFIINSSPVLIPRINRSSSSTRLAVPYDIHNIFMKFGYEFMDDIYWQKPAGAGWASGRGRRFAADRNPMQYKPVPVTENIMVYRKKSNKLIDWFIRKHPNQSLIKESKIPDGYEKTNIWKINPVSDKRHPAIFPIELAEKVIQYYSFKNDVILDPFGGLGTTAKAAIEMERRFVSIELSKEYFEDSLNDLERDYGIFLNNIKIKRS